uniref:Dopamine receptor D4 n=1 Tax=Corvus moneduloides TaxID=1196302 RepID=A0A8C3EH29_CORMO
MGNGTAGPSPAAPGHSIAALVLGILLILLIVGGNGLVCLSVCTERALKTTTNYFIVSLAVADLLLALLVLPLYVYSEFQGGVWSLSTVLCDALMTMDVMLCTASIFNLCAISVDRFIAVQIPLNYNRRQIDLRQLILISTTWILAFAVASPVIFGLNNVPDRDPSLCQLEDDNYIVYSSICSFFIPCPVMLVLYCGMFQGLKRWEEARKAKLRGCIYGANRKLYHPPTLMEREQSRLGPPACSPYARASLPGECGMNNGIQTVSYPHLSYPHPGHGRKRAKINGRERKAMRVLPVVVVPAWLSLEAQLLLEEPHTVATSSSSSMAPQCCPPGLLSSALRGKTFPRKQPGSDTHHLPPTAGAPSPPSMGDMFAVNKASNSLIGQHISH